MITKVLVLNIIVGTCYCGLVLHFNRTFCQHLIMFLLNVPKQNLLTFMHMFKNIFFLFMQSNVTCNNNPQV